MDLSANQKIDFMYLTNPLILDKFGTSVSVKNELTDEDIKFYRKRILMNTKTYLRGGSINNVIDAAFENYANEMIKYFKFIDKKDMIQQQYNNLPVKKKKKVKTFDLMDQNSLMMKTKENTVKTIKDYLPIVVKEKPAKKMIIPKQQNFNIKDPSLKNKGIR